MLAPVLETTLPLLAAGVGAGLLAGLLGVGGGIVMVPILALLLPAIGVGEQVAMHVAVATSLAVIVVTSLLSARAHARRGALDEQQLRAWALPVAVGALVGAVLARLMPGDALRLMFALLALAVGLRMLLARASAPRRLTLGRTQQSAVACAVGIVSCWLGIGGGTFSVPILHATGLSMQRAVGTGALLGFFIALPGALGFAIAGLGVPDLPRFSLGFVHWPSAASLALGALLLVPLGARLAHRAPQTMLRRLFGLFLLFAGGRMAVTAIT